MGTTEQKLEYLSETKSLLKTAIQSKLSGYITFDTENLREIVTYVNRILNEPKIAIIENEFKSLSSLTSIIIPDTVTSIGNNAFELCINLTSVIFGSGITSIGNNAFNNCRHLTTITMPNSIMNIGSNAFYGCSGLNSVTILANSPPILKDNNVFNGSYPIYVPADSVESYKAASKWSSFADRIQAIPT